MSTLRNLAFLPLLLAASQAPAANFSFTGNLAGDDYVQLFEFDVDSLSTVVLRTWSYGGGVNADGATIDPGGFDPILTLFDAAGALLDDNDDGGMGNPDPVTGSVWDSYLSLELDAGSYTLALTQYSSFAWGSLLSQGFGGSGAVDFNDRTAFWAVDIENVASASVGETYVSAVPVPAALWLFIPALGLLWKSARQHPARPSAQG